MKKLVILVDMDGIIADLMGRLLGLYNLEFGTYYTHSQITNWNFDKCVPNGKVLYKYMSSPGLFKSLDPIPGAIEALRALKKAGHELHIATTPYIKGTCSQDKLDWVEQYLPFIGGRNTILIRDKTMLKGDVLIDDKPDTIERYRATWPVSVIASIAYPYNEIVKDKLDIYAHGFNNFEQAWEIIQENIAWFANKSS